MLDIFFLNVGDGDAVVFRTRRADGSEFVLMVDTGRPVVEFVKGSRRAVSLYGLREQGIRRIDLLIITHLHIDHLGGTIDILRHLTVARMLVPYEDGEGRFIDPPFETDEKKYIGFAQMLNIWHDTLEEARRCGCQLETLQEGRRELTPDFSMELFLPCAEALKQQKRVAYQLYRGESPMLADWYEAADRRNISGPLCLLRYAGRRILMTADVYARNWEELGPGLGPVDVLKLPHHGDPKSMTEPLIAALRPRVCLVSCQNDPLARKDRPNAEIVAMVQRYAGLVICTENKELPTLATATHRFVQIRIHDDGRMELNGEELE